MSDNKLVFRGNILKIMDVVTGESDNGKWKSISFVVKENKDDYPQSAVFRLFGNDKVDNFIKYNSVGKLVDVSFNLKVNTGADKERFFNNLDAWKVFSVSSDTGDVEKNANDDDLPF